MAQNSVVGCPLHFFNVAEGISVASFGSVENNFEAAVISSVTYC
jgi:hypothetical protein